MISETLDPKKMTVEQARHLYNFARDPINWHYQPKCVCGDYICQHDQLPPHRCGFSSRPDQCRCYSYRFGRMGTGPRPEDAERWIAGGAPDTRPAGDADWPDRGTAENGL